MREFRVGVVGCGVVASAYYLPHLARDDRVVIEALCDLNVGRAIECRRLFNARSVYGDYFEMLEKADIDVVFILTAPGTHVPFALAAIEAGKHLLIQKPMATTMDDARRIAQAVRKSNLKVIVEPSSQSPLDPDVAHVRQLVKSGVLGQHLWFTAGATGPAAYDKSLTVNPYGQAAFYAKDSGGFLFDMPYAPASIVSLLGACKSVSAVARVSLPAVDIVPETQYDLDRSQRVPNQGYDNVYSVYEMVDGSIGALHIGRIFHPVLVGSGSGALQIFGTDGNLIAGCGHFVSIISRHGQLLPRVDEDGWYRVPLRGDRGKARWPQPVPGAFNYYHASSTHLIDCILNDTDPIPNVEWGLHITEMMAGAAISAETGRKYEMTTTIDY